MKNETKIRRLKMQIKNYEELKQLYQNDLKSLQYISNIIEAKKIKLKELQ